MNKPATSKHESNGQITASYKKVTLAIVIVLVLAALALAITMILSDSEALANFEFWGIKAQTAGPVAIFIGVFYVLHRVFGKVFLLLSGAVFAIAGIIAIPSYQDYTIRSKTSEGIALSVPLKLQVSEYYLQNGHFPDDLSDLGISEPITTENWTVSLVRDGVIIADFSYPDHSGYVRLVPEPINGQEITWTCVGHADDPSALPATCR